MIYCEDCRKIYRKYLEPRRCVTAEFMEKTQKFITLFEQIDQKNLICCRGDNHKVKFLPKYIADIHGDNCYKLAKMFGDEDYIDINRLMPSELLFVVDILCVTEVL